MAKEPEGSPADLYRKGNECFVSEDYDRAIELYTTASAQDPTLTECYAAKAQAYIKTERFELAKKEADRGVDVLRSLGQPDDRANGELKKCLQRSGVACFHMGKYKEARNAFSEALKYEPSDKGMSQWLTWCDEKIHKFGEDASKKTPTSDTKQEEKSNTTQKPSQTEEKPSVEKQPDQPPASQMPVPVPVPKIKHDWYQTETQVVIEVRIKNLKQSDVTVDFHETSLSVTAKLAVGSDYSLELDLAHPVVPNQSSYKVMSTKIEIKLRKVEGVRWSALEGDGSTPIPGGAPVAASPGGVKAPYASGRDWNKMEKMLEKEAEEKKEGESALNEMFQKIYADANDDVKKAMNKSFQESGGTVLSTNWSEIGKDKVDVKPPDGMEYRKWE